MVTDPLLQALRAKPLQYVISGPEPVSIRDQILRGVGIVDRLKAAGDIGPDRPLVVVGAGAGGVSVAMAASQLDIETFLIERTKEAFTAQRSATSRWIDPTQYDWPLDHYGEGVLPWDTVGHCALPFTFGAGRASELAKDWRSTLASKAPPELTMLAECELRRVQLLGRSDNSDEMLEVELSNGLSIQAGALVDARGFGIERCTFGGDPKSDPPTPPDYEGTPFWGPDTFENLLPDVHRVLISGSGDGALQDYLRIVTHCKSAAEILAACGLDSGTLRTIQSAEDRAVRGRSWASLDTDRQAEQEGPYLHELDAVHRQVVSDLLNDTAMQLNLARIVPARIVPVHLITRTAFMTAYYGLNQFLVRLLAEYIQRPKNPATRLLDPNGTTPGPATVFPGVEIASIKSIHPAPPCIDPKTRRASGILDPVTGLLIKQDCFSRDHEVKLAASLPGGKLPQEQLYNVIIIRHGLTARPSTNLEPARHLPPYHLPCQ